MKQMQVTVQKVDFSRYQRVIAVSDLHGDLAGFKKMLRQVEFSANDALVIVGDILEKGTQSIPLLRRVMEMSRAGNVYMVAGNHEAFFLEWFSGLATDTEIFSYLPELLQEMSRTLDLPCVSVEDMPALKTAAAFYFTAELAFLRSLPVILDSDLAIFVHAGLQPKPLSEQTLSYCLSAKGFSMQKDIAFEKPVVVGHWPTCNYSADVIDANVHYNREANIISIDGGNSLKRWGQINVLEMDPQTGAMRNRSCDTLPMIRALDAQKADPAPLTLVFPQTLLEMEKAGPETSLCYLPALGREMLISNKDLYLYKDRTYCADFTTWHPDVEVGELLALCNKTAEDVLIKKDGIIGHYSGRYEPAPLVLEKPTMAYAEDILALRQELITIHDADAFAGCNQLEYYDNVADWLAYLKQCRNGENDKVPSDVYLAIRPEDDKIVGIIDFRHHIDHPILGLWGGHIGYIVRPEERGKGYAKEMLRLNLSNCKNFGLDKVLVTCTANNPASEHVILANGGVFEKEVLVDEQHIKRYWIKL